MFKISGFQPAVANRLFIRRTFLAMAFIQQKTYKLYKNRFTHFYKYGWIDVAYNNPFIFLRYSISFLDIPACSPLS